MTDLTGHVAVLGLGASGEAAARLLLSKGIRVTACDAGCSPALEERAARLEAAGARVVLKAEGCPQDAELAVLSPGIDLSAPLAASAAALGIPILGEIELAFRFCECPVAAITGTNGKTTTTSLTGHMLRGAGLRCAEAGNIGLPFCEAVATSRELDVMVLEVSSFQLETIETFHPRAAAFLNFSPNHLDRYRSVDDYFAAKLRIFENQKPADWAVVNAALELPGLRARRVTFSASRADADWSLRDGHILRGGSQVIELAATTLTGPHNAENLMAALALGDCLGADLGKMVAVAPA
ncbi:MAG: UDP-N-acetylmuramoyl-L-alanine--D-glutamate ligase, partial [Terrimicrobiaceae bacterium]|nr:UDP-N-acetylmuramoyl-L-alanine--D-glutamate ligase [Terrimicrobiaceae bacterium]